MRICVDFTSAIGDATGVGTYARELVRALLLRGAGPLRLGVHAFRHPRYRMKIKALLAGVPGSYEVRASRLLPHGLLLEADRRLGLPIGEMLFGDTDVYHGTNFLAPRFTRARTVVTVHDLAWLRHREEVPVAHRYERYLSRSLARADRVIAVSEATQDDIIEYFDVPADRIDVVHEGAPAAPRSLDPEAFRKFRHRHRIPEDYLLFLGTLEPRKNLVRLLEACRLLADRGCAPSALVLAGRKGWHDEEIRRGIEETRRRLPVVTPGFVSEEQKVALYRHARAFVFPSLYEGFGLPVLEAFTAGTPVVASRAGALPEVAGDAALLVDPRDTEGMADALRQCLSGEDLCRTLVERGTHRAKEFTWARTARETMDVYRRAVNRKSATGEARGPAS
jgi:glycosyltransferase involved in cell wall biosynthesis